MRLTLRTLLAYLDGVLNEQDRADLQQQIESTPVASELVHRTRDVSGRIKLGAPDPLGSGPVDNPNTVAEYLDGTLPEESIPEFERVCLESDMMLAEVASCHQVLKLVLEKPVTIEESTRQRLANLREELEAAQQESAQEDTPAPQPAEQSATPNPEPFPARAPDYLRDAEPSPFAQWAPAGAAVALLLLMIYFAFGPGGWLRNAEVAKSDQATVTTSEEPIPAEGQPEEVVEEIVEEVPAAVGPSQEEASEEQPAEEVEQLDPTPEAVEEPGGEPAQTESVPEEESSDQVGEKQEVQAEEGAEEAAAEQPSELPEAPPEPVEPPPAIGVFAGPEGTLLMNKPEGVDWRRVSLGTEMGSEELLLSLPTYRPMVNAGDGLTIELVDHSQLKATHPTDGLMRLELFYGKMIVALAEGSEPATIELVMSDSMVEIGLPPGKRIAIESDRLFEPGHDTLAKPTPLYLVVYAPEGGITWKSGGDTYTYGEPRQLTLAEGGALSSIKPYGGDPGWIEPAALSDWDSLASPYLPSQIDSETGLGMKLLEMIKQVERIEVVSLASRCALAIDEPGPLVASFTEDRQAMLWRANLALLRAEASHGVAQAASIRRAFEEKYGPEQAADMMRLLVGFRSAGALLTDEVDTPEALLWTIEQLGSDSLGMRVLAGLVVDELVGEPAGFDPLDSPSRRRTAIRRIRRNYL